jgi:hypothetical protein
MAKKKITREQVADFIRNAGEDDIHALVRLTNARSEEWKAKGRSEMAYIDFLDETEEPF